MRSFGLFGLGERSGLSSVSAALAFPAREMGAGQRGGGFLRLMDQVPF